MYVNGRLTPVNLSTEDLLERILAGLEAGAGAKTRDGAQPGPADAGNGATKS
jgi:hypothetical protein